MGIRRIRAAVRKGRYEFTLHALEEMDEADMGETDVRSALLNGRVTATLGADPRGIRFVVRGTARDRNAKVEVVCEE